MFKILVAVILYLRFAQAVYFTMTNISLILFAERDNYPPRNHPLLILYALPENRHNEELDKALRFKISDQKNYLQIFPSTGDLMFKENFFTQTKGPEVISARAFVEDSRGRKNSTDIEIVISPENPLDCDLKITELCFWKSANYMIYENTKPSVIGSLSSPYILEICKGYSVNYTLTKGSNQFKLAPPTENNKLWTLHSARPLERDVFRIPFSAKSDDSGESRTVSVRCFVENPNRTIFDGWKDLTIKILDEDDNPPKARSTGPINISLNSSDVKKGQYLEHEDFLITDRDSVQVNSYTIDILNDSLEVLDRKCTIYEDDRDGESQMAIHCKLFFTRDAEINQFPYKIVLRINDTTLLPGHGKSSIAIGIHIHCHSCSKYLQRPESMGLTIAPSDSNRPLLLYPKKEVRIFRTAGPLARVTQPNRFEGLSQFSIRNDSTRGGFNVTRNHGIVFVEDISLIRNASSPIRLEVQWYNHSSVSFDVLSIVLENEPNAVCTKLGGEIKEWSFCSKSKTFKDCEKTCGLSTGGSASVAMQGRRGSERCMWRGDKIPGTSPSRFYSTCTPDIETCPDRLCDELEELHPLICPQDCSVNILFPSSMNPKTRRGLDIGAGICFCTPMAQCGCKFPPQKNKKLTSSEAYTTTLPTNYAAENDSSVQPKFASNRSSPVVLNGACGTSCILGIFSGLVFLAFLIGMFVYCWRNDYKRKLKRNRTVEESQDPSVPITSERIEHQETLLLNLDFTSDVLCQSRNLEVDPEWEFPREGLIIEQVLGEGEFGRVLRAKALDIAGNVGYTTVAVKTLKDDAGERELADLLSEYRLLKDVSHPNVIRLLGASTSPGGPVYLIIEFAEHGSLRTFLRKCRHIQTESSIRSSTGEEWTRQTHYDEPSFYKVSARDIISFAWQIAKGMAYLSDMKLVHRDLAARNVLLASGKVCKVSDFGLTRDVYEDDAYFKKSKGRVPVKWMAPESLSDQIYTNKSDVWSFGVLVWELVTLGASPYPGIAVQSLFHLLRSGYRMEKPENCSLKLYQIMRGCWQAEPEQRPTFSDLADKFEKMLSDEVQYLDVSGNAVYNRSYFLEPQEDLQSENEAVQGVAEKITTDPVNYLDRSQQYVKCGESKKLDLEGEDGAFGASELPTRRSENHQGHQGYETPVKVPKKSSSVQTPTNECPRYGYTEMTAIKAD